MTVVVGLSRAFERGVGALRLVFLDKTQDDVNHDDGHDDAKILPLAQEERNPCRCQDDIDQRAFDLVEQDRPGRNALLDGQSVFAVLLPPREYLVGRETV